MKTIAIASLVAALLFTTFTGPVIAAPSAKGAQDFPVIKYEKYKLPNGLEVILSEDHRLPLVAVDVWYHVGPANERPGLTGFAHLFEHMMFQGSKHVKANEHFKYLEAAGASGINGTTNYDRTNYFETLPANQLELGLWLESDRMGWLLENLTARNLANQRDVVRNERRQGEGFPYDVVEEELMHNMLPKGHPYYGSVIGSHADIESAELKDVREFHELYYKPNNATVAIAGDFNPKTIKDQVERYFGPIPSGPPVPKIDVSTPQITSERRLTVTDEVELSRLYLGWLAPPIYHPGDVEANLLARILGGGKSSRLYKKLVYEKQIAQDVTADDDREGITSMFTIAVTAKPGVKLEDLEKEVDAELSELQKHGPTKEEVEGARNTVETQLIQPLERLGGFGGVADRLNYYNHYLGDPGYLPKDLESYESVAPAAIKTAAQALTPTSRVVVFAVPGKKIINDVPKRDDPALKAAAPAPEPDKPEQAWRATPPKPGPALVLSLPVPEQFKLNNGLTVLLSQQHTLPTVSASMVVLSGSERNPPDRPGLAGFTAAMLQEGTEKRPALRLADDVDQIGASLDTNSNADRSGVTIRALSRNTDSAMELLSDVALHPAFRDADLERVRKQRMTALMQQKENPYILVAKFFNLNLYGDSSPYAYLEEGTETATQATTREDLKKFYQAGYAPKDSALVISGDVNLAQARELAEKYFGNWSGSAVASAPPEGAGSQKRRVVIVDRPGANQTMVRIGQGGIARNHPDYAPVEVMNTILGGLFSSRVNLNLREEHGYTYGAFSRFQYHRGPGPFFVNSAIRTDVTAPAIEETFKELGRMSSTEPTAEEMDLSKDSITRSLAGDFESNAQVTGVFGGLFVYGLPLDYYRTFPATVNAVGPKDVQRVAKQHLDPDSMLVVAVGDRAKIAPGIEKLNLGPVQFLDVSGKPLTDAAPAAQGAK